MTRQRNKGREKSAHTCARRYCDENEDGSVVWMFRGAQSTGNMFQMSNGLYSSALIVSYNSHLMSPLATIIQVSIFALMEPHWIFLSNEEIARGSERRRGRRDGDSTQHEGDKTDPQIKSIRKIEFAISGSLTPALLRLGEARVWVLIMRFVSIGIQLGSLSLKQTDRRSRVKANTVTQRGTNLRHFARLNGAVALQGQAEASWFCRKEGWNDYKGGKCREAALAHPPLFDCSSDPTGFHKVD